MSYLVTLADEHYTENKVSAVVMIGANSQKNQQSASINTGDQN
jgi:hypothetical protein